MVTGSFLSARSGRSAPDSDFVLRYDPDSSKRPKVSEQARTAGTRNVPPTRPLAAEVAVPATLFRHPLRTERYARLSEGWRGQTESRGPARRFTQPFSSDTASPPRPQHAKRAETLKKAIK
jgi:hypothetical protein